MPTDLRIIAPNRPGASKAALGALAAAGINIEGVCGDLRPGETWGYLHLLVDDPGSTVGILEAAGFEVTSVHEVELVDLTNEPGALEEALQPYWDAGRNIEIIYLTGESRLVIGTEDMRRPIPGVRAPDAKYA